MHIIIWNLVVCLTSPQCESIHYITFTFLQGFVYIVWHHHASALIWLLYWHQKTTLKNKKSMNAGNMGQQGAWKDEWDTTISCVDTRHSAQICHSLGSQTNTPLSALLTQNKPWVLGCCLLNQIMRELEDRNIVLWRDNLHRHVFLIDTWSQMHVCDCVFCL